MQEERTLDLDDLDLDYDNTSVIEGSDFEVITMDGEEYFVVDTDEDDDDYDESEVISDAQFIIDDTDALHYADDFSWFGNLIKKGSNILKKANKAALRYANPLNVIKDIRKKLVKKKNVRKVKPSAFKFKKSKRPRPNWKKKQNVIIKASKDDVADDIYGTKFIRKVIRKALRIKAPVVPVYGIAAVTITTGRRLLKYKTRREMITALTQAADSAMEKAVVKGVMPGAAALELDLTSYHIWGTVFRTANHRNAFNPKMFYIEAKNSGATTYTVFIEPKDDAVSVKLLMFNCSMGNSEGAIRGSATLKINIPDEEIADAQSVSCTTLTSEDLGNLT